MPVPQAIFFGPDPDAEPLIARAWAIRHGFDAISVSSVEALMDRALRSLPRCVVFANDSAESLTALRRLKADSFTGIVPAVVFNGDDPTGWRLAIDEGADEALPAGMDAAVIEARLDLLLRRSDRDVNVHPSTRLPGTVTIEAEVERRLAEGAPFAMCYADLDHFKEYNDRYSFYDGDRVIRMLSRVLHDVVKGLCGEAGFVGHIGGDDFIFVIAADSVAETCGEAVRVFDTLIPYQYSEQDRRAGYFFGKDRRGQLHRVPLMTLSIGVVTNERRTMTSAAEVSHLATEMKGYAKTLPGSVYSVDRRADASATPAGASTPPRAPRAISVVDE